MLGRQGAFPSGKTAPLIESVCALSTPRQRLSSRARVNLECVHLVRIANAMRVPYSTALSDLQENAGEVYCTTCDKWSL
jgi:hypothetical protein